MVCLPIRVMIVDDHEIVRAGLHGLLGQEPDIDIVGMAADGAEALALAGTLHPNVILLDLRLPEIDGIEAIYRIHAVSPASHVIVLTSFADNRSVYAAIRAGVVGYLLKDVLKPDLLRAIRAAARGESTLHPEVQRQLMQQVNDLSRPSLIERLTEREHEVLCLIAVGHSNKEIAAILSLTEGTVKVYVSAILSKLNVHDRTQAALYAVKHGLVPIHYRGTRDRLEMHQNYDHK